MKKWIILIIVVTLLVFAAIIFVGVALTTMMGSGGGSFGVSSNSMLMMDMAGYFPEEPPEDFRGMLLDKEVITHRKLLHIIHAAKTDDRIHGIYLKLGSIQNTGYARMHEIRNALRDFKTSGKPITAFMEAGDDRDYYLATAADRICMPAEGLLLMDGLYAEMMFFKDTFAKVGIEWEEVHHGKYKSAPESYTRNDMSEANREVMNAILDGIYHELLTAVMDGRGFTEEQARAAFDNGPYLVANIALEAGIIDELVYEEKLLEEVSVGENRSFEALRLEDYATDVDFPKRGEKIALIYATGTIVSGENSNDPLGEKYMGSDSITEWLDSARRDEDVRAVVMRVDSPGGSALASDIIWNEVQKTRLEKPVVISMGDLAASGGYYISMGADYIYAEPTTLTGSIGVFFMKPVIGGLYDKLELATEVMQRGENSGLLTLVETMSPEERMIIQGFVDNTYQVFVSKAAAGRNMTYEDLDAIAQGRVWMGAEALANGLVDEMGGLNDAVDKAKELAGLTPDKAVHLDVYPRKKDFFELLEEGGFPFSAKLDLPPEIAQALGYHTRRMHFRQGEALALMPYQIKVE